MENVNENNEKEVEKRMREMDERSDGLHKFPEE